VLSRADEPSAPSIRPWINQTEPDAAKRSDGLTTERARHAVFGYRGNDTFRLRHKTNYILQSCKRNDTLRLCRSTCLACRGNRRSLTAQWLRGKLTPNNQHILRQNGRKSAYSLLSKIACGTTGKRTPRR